MILLRIVVSIFAMTLVFYCLTSLFHMDINPSGWPNGDRQDMIAYGFYIGLIIGIFWNINRGKKVE